MQTDGTTTPKMIWGRAEQLGLVLAAFLSVYGLMVAPVSSLPTSGGWTLIAVGLLGLSLPILFWMLRGPIGRGVEALAAWTLEWPLKHWVAACFGVGLVLRVAVFLIVGPEQVADKGVYWDMAGLIAAGEPLVYDTFLGPVRAVYPPGLPFMVAPFVLIFGHNPATILIFNLVVLAVSLAVLAWFALRHFGPATARIATLIIALWPNHVFGASMMSKELVVPIFVIALLGLGLEAVRSGAVGRFWRSLQLSAANGVLIGVTVLTQPAFALVPAVLFGLECLWSRSWRGSAARLTVAAALTIAVLTPWTIRNYMVLDAFIPFTTSGGHGLLMANNDKSVGGWMPIEHVFPDWKNFNEAELNAESTRRALEWMQDNPAGVVKLAIRKQMAFMCCSDGEIFDNLWWGARIDGVPYGIAATIANVFWLTLLGLVLIGSYKRLTDSAMTREPPMPPLTLLLMLPILCSFFINSIVLSHHRFNFMHSGIWAILACLLLAECFRQLAKDRPVKAD